MQELLLKDDPCYVPPFPGSIVKLIGPKSPFKHHGDVICFLAYKDGKVVGRIAAVENRSHNAFHKDNLGFFGFFDFIDDFEVASALFDSAKQELSARGKTVLRGPYNPSINDETGLLVEGFDTIPFVLMPHNPPFYGPMYEKLGLKQARDLYAFHMANGPPPERVARIADRIRKHTGVSLRSMQLKNLAAELQIIRDLYNSTLCRNWGYVPITAEDLDHAAKDLKEIVAPDMLLIAEKNGKPVGFSLAIPNINEFLAKTKKSNRVMRALKFIWALKTKHPKEARLAAMGVHPEYRNTGIAALFYYESMVRGKGRYTGGELSWVEETNHELIKSLKVLGGTKYKTYRIYETPVALN